MFPATAVAAVLCFLLAIFECVSPQSTATSSQSCDAINDLTNRLQQELRNPRLSDDVINEIMSLASQPGSRLLSEIVQRFTGDQSTRVYSNVVKLALVVSSTII